VNRFWICDFGLWIGDRPLTITNKSVHILLSVIITGWLTAAVSLADGENLPKIKPAPEFTLTKQDGKRLALKELRGKVLAITFIFASCADTCPLLTAKMAGIQNRLGTAFGPEVNFLSITVDPERDTPDVLQHYAQAHKANPVGWAFLTGTPAEIRDVAKRYGVYYQKTPRGDVDHTFLTSLVDQNGTLRVQYMGVKFDPDKMLRDLQSLVKEREKIRNSKSETNSKHEMPNNDNVPNRSDRI
jgi:protein SCO1